MNRPGSRWFAAVSGGLFGGSLAGVLEALWILTSMTPSEYQAVLYGLLIYGAIGGVGGALLGAVAAAAGDRVRPALAWCGSFFGVAATLGWFILRYLLNKGVYREEGVPPDVLVLVGLALLAISVVGTWFGHNVLTKTPLRALARPKGTLALWGGCAGLATTVALAPAPAASGVEVPRHPQDGTADRPNIVLVQVDALRFDAVGVDGHAGRPPAESDTPALDAFAADGVVFEQHIAAASWTRPSVASLLTSRSPSAHGCVGKDDRLDDALVTLPEALAGANYATGGFPNNPNVTAALGFAQGFDWYPYAPSYPLGARESSYALSMYSVARKVYARVRPDKRVSEYYTPAEVQLPRVRDWIAAQGSDRWFAFVHLMEPHDPYFSHPYNGQAASRAANPNPAASHAEELHALYAGEVRHLDTELGRFFEDLKAAGLYDDALIVVTSDHGEEFHEHGGWWHGTTLYDEQIHVPLIVKLPHGDRAGTRVPWQTRAIDVPATVLDLAGVPLPEGWQGETVFSDDFDQQLAVTLPPVVEPGDPAVPWSAPNWGQLPASRAALSEEQFEGYVLQSLRADGKKLFQAPQVPAGPRGLPSEAVFDLIADPREVQPRLDDPATEGLRMRLFAAVGAGGGGQPPPDPAREGLSLLGYPEAVP